MAKSATVRRRVILVLFVLYVLVILFLLVFPNNYRHHNVFVGGLTFGLWRDYVADGFNLVPLRGIFQQIRSIFAGQNAARNVIYLVGNLIGFAPLGFFLPLLFERQRRFGVFIITVLLALVALELVQLLTIRGSFDIDDIIFNVTGACLGFFFLRRVTCLKNSKEDNPNADFS